LVDQLISQLAAFESISLDDLTMNTVLNRLDTKYLLVPEQLSTLLDILKDDFRILEIDGNRLMSYETKYFDTPDYRLFLDHHNGFDRRIKVRIRTYTESQLHYFEVKRKQTGNVTIKDRMLIDEAGTDLDEHCLQLIQYQRIGDQPLRFSLRNNFERITLVGKHGRERITIDRNICFENEKGAANLGDIVVLELKQDTLNRQSLACKALKELALRPDSFSKYAIGIILTTSHSRYNNFKPTLLKVRKLSHQDHADHSYA
jgi:hypothetical protein